MDKSVEFVSPKHLARAIGVSESSLKRWCDQGLIKATRTAGGHRKLSVADALRFVREHDQALASPELLGLPALHGRGEMGLAEGRQRFIRGLVVGDETLVRQVLFNLYMSKHRLSVIFDDVIAKAFHQIGDRWACHEIDVYHERRSCEIAHRVLHEIRRIQQPRPGAEKAIGGTAEGDRYMLASTMAELVLREAGFEATALGTAIPFPSMSAAVRDIRPRLFWLSVSHIEDEQAFAEGFATLSEACSNTGSALVVGGRVLGESIRQRLVYSAYCDTMQQLERFADALRPIAKPAEPVLELRPESTAAPDP